MKKYTLISAGISVALFATALTVSLVTNSSTNKRFEEEIAGVKNQIETNKSEASQSIESLEKQLQDTKAALEAAISSSKADLETLVGTNVEELKAADAKNLKTLSDAVKSVEDAVKTAKEELAKADADNLAKVEKTINDRVTAATTALDTVKQALEARVALVENNVAANAEQISKLSTDLTTLAGKIGEISNGSAANLADWIDKFQNDDAIDAKGNAVSALNKTYIELQAEIAEKSASVSSSTEDKVTDALRDAYYRGFVKISLSLIDEVEGALDELETELDGILEPVRFEYLRNNIEGFYDVYEDALRAEVNAMNISAEDCKKANDAFDTLDLVAKDYEKLTTSAELEALLEAKKLEADKPYYVAKLEDAKNDGVDHVDGLGYISNEYAKARTDAISAVKYADKAIDNATSRSQVRDLYAAEEEKVNVQVALADGQNGEAKRYDEFKTVWLENKFDEISPRTNEKKLSDAEQNAAETAYKAIMENYDWDSAAGLTSAELKAKWNAEAAELDAVKAEYVELYELETLKDTTVANFVVFKDQALNSIDQYTWLTAGEKVAIYDLIDVVEIADLSSMETKDAVKAEYTRVETIIKNILTLASGENEENQAVVETKALIESSVYSSVLNPHEVTAVKNELEGLDKNYQFIDGYYKSTMTTSDLVAAGEALDGKVLTDLIERRRAAFKNLTEKYNTVIETTNKVHDIVSFINNNYKKDIAGDFAENTGFCEEVGNDYGYEIRVKGEFKGDFVQVPTDLTAEEVKAKAEKYLKDIEAIGDEAEALFNAFMYDDANDDSKDGACIKANRIVSDFVAANGLTAEEVEAYYNELRDLKTVKELYDEIQEAASYEDVLDAYKAEYDAVYSKAAEHYDARVLAYANETANYSKVASHLNGWAAIRGIEFGAFVYSGVELTADLIGEVTIVVDKNGELIFAQDTTVGTLPTLNDVHYTSGSSIFVLGEKYAEDPTDYSVVLPAGATLVTGSAAVMADKVIMASNLSLAELVNTTDGSLSGNVVVVNDLFDTYAESTWDTLAKELDTLVKDTAKASKECTTVADVKAEQADFVKAFDAIVDRYEKLYKELDASVLASEQAKWKQEIEEVTIEYREVYKELDLRLNLVRDAFKNKIDNCKYSYEVEPIYGEFEVQIQITATGEVMEYVKSDGTYTNFVWDLQNQVYTYTCTSSTWQRFQFKYTKDGEETVLTYDNTTFSGAVRGAGQYGADWYPNLYTDDASTAAQGYFWTCTGGMYTFTFNPDTMEFHVEAN